MRSLQKIFLLLFITTFYVPSYAAVNGVELKFCSVYSEADKKDVDDNDEKGEDKKGENEKGEEEPDCD